MLTTDDPDLSPRLSRKRMQTRGRLMSSAFEVFAEQGIAAASIEAICERAAFTRGAFYSNFASKEDLFLAMYDDEVTDRADRLRRSIDDATAAAQLGTPQALVRSILEAFTSSYARDRTWFLLVSEMEVQGMRSRELGSALATVRNRLSEAIAEIISRRAADLGVSVAVVANAIPIISGVYEAALKRAALTSEFEEARAQVLDTLPRVLEPLMRTGPEIADPDGAARSAPGAAPSR